mgnify:CR=1 FL=1
MPTFSFTGPSILPLAQQIERATQLFKSPEPLLMAWSKVVVQEIQENFRLQGKPARWQPLTPWTIAGRKIRSRGKGAAAVPLQDTGKMRRGWNMHNVQISAKQAIIFNPDPKQVFHEFGTRGPYPITAKNGKMLRLPNPEGGVTERKRRNRNYNATRQKGQNFYTPGKGFYSRHGSHVSDQYIFLPKVMHPGIPARPVLPEPRDIHHKLVAVADVQFLKTALGRAARQGSLPPLGPGNVGPTFPGFLGPTRFP